MEWAVQNEPITKNGILPITTLFFRAVGVQGDQAPIKYSLLTFFIIKDNIKKLKKCKVRFTVKTGI